MSKLGRGHERASWAEDRAGTEPCGREKGEQRACVERGVQVDLKQ